MVIDKIYPNPTVKQVIFQITYPNLFYLENRIGALQEKLMREFPDTNLIFRRGLLFTDIGPNQKIEIPSEELEKNTTKKIWQFKSKNNTILSITSNSLDISSEFHKTYNLGGDNSKKFRYALEYAVGAFLDVVKLPIINRIGLRYIDHCPLITKDNTTLKEWYNSTFPLDRFKIEDATAMAFQTIVKKGEYNLRYAESLGQIDGVDKLILDFDGFAVNIENVSEYLTITDKLHEIISDAYKSVIKSPVYEYMENKQMIIQEE